MTPHRLLLILAIALPAGCSRPAAGPSTRPASMQQRQEQALKDPFHYSPDMGSGVSGGGIGELDKDALKRDWDSFWNP